MPTNMTAQIINPIPHMLNPCSALKSQRAIARQIHMPWQSPSGLETLWICPPGVLILCGDCMVATVRPDLFMARPTERRRTVAKPLVPTVVESGLFLSFSIPPIVICINFPHHAVHDAIRGVIHRTCPKETGIPIVFAYCDMAAMTIP